MLIPRKQRGSRSPHDARHPSEETVIQSLAPSPKDKLVTRPDPAKRSREGLTGTVTASHNALMAEQGAT